MPMTTHRPYLVRALNEWILDNNCTPYILVNAFEKGVEVPQSYVKDGQIVLNISPIAVHGLVITNDGIEFNGRFWRYPDTCLCADGCSAGNLRQGKRPRDDL